MTRLRTAELPESLIESGQSLHGIEDIESVYIGDDHTYFMVERSERLLGKMAIILTEGGFGDAEGFTNFRNQVTLVFNRKGSLRSIADRYSVEINGPKPGKKINVSTDHIGNSYLDWIKDKLKISQRKPERNQLQRVAANYIARTLSLAKEAKD